MASRKVTDDMYARAAQNVMRRYWEIKHENHGTYIFIHDLADYMNIGYRTAKRYLSQETCNLTVVSMVQFCNALGINVETFFKDVARELRKLQLRDQSNGKVKIQYKADPRLVSKEKDSNETK